MPGARLCEGTASCSEPRLVCGRAFGWGSVSLECFLGEQSTIRDESQDGIEPLQF